MFVLEAVLCQNETLGECFFVGDDVIVMKTGIVIDKIYLFVCISFSRNSGYRSRSFKVCSYVYVVYSGKGRNIMLPRYCG